VYKKEMGTSLARTNDEFYIVKYNDVYQINETSARIFELCNGKTSVDEIISKLFAFYELSSNEFAEFEVDITTFLNELVNLGLIRKR